MSPRLFTEYRKRKNVIIASRDDQIRPFFANKDLEPCDIFCTGCSWRNEVYPVATEISRRIGKAVRTHHYASLPARAQRLNNVLSCEAAGAQKKQSEIRTFHFEPSFARAGESAPELSAARFADAFLRY